MSNMHIIVVDGAEHEVGPPIVVPLLVDLFEPAQEASRGYCGDTPPAPAEVEFVFPDWGIGEDCPFSKDELMEFAERKSCLNSKSIIDEATCDVIADGGVYDPPERNYYYYLGMEDL